ncbi:MAG TPA: right-handed parallel beta-helix repeat-containing protein [Flexivirga sp.]|uniref:right-handed parallel beta-helix repeat-containing protein n=1 Tax=Flexivirga sp. TaxID=1962927 RepID=UPI002C08C32B|nr:right-handed parallel beta-helix repeat-containing protein [Flexivirga sp.]HWC21619.1 right-handed parallel beta-helix repeat-containing protein [Flexivirga sp.]
MSMHQWRPAVVGVAAVSTALLGLTYAPPAHADGVSCTPDAGGSGLSAAVVAQPHRTIADRTIDATGCDIGIYVGPGATHVTISGVTVENANFQGIFAERTSHLRVAGSTLTGNGFHTTDPSAPPLEGSGVKSYVGQAFAISLFGVSHSAVVGNSVHDNGRGGIGVMDNGANDPGWLMQKQNPDAPLVPSTYDVIAGNHTWSNYSGCGIVTATQNFGGRLSNLQIMNNTITGTIGQFTANGPDIGGIVVAADPPESRVDNVNVMGNSVSQSFEGGIIVNAEAFNSSTNRVTVSANTVTANNWGHLEAPQMAGVLVYANPAPIPPGTTAPRNVATTVTGNTLGAQFYGIWSLGDFAPKTAGNTISVTPGGTPIFHG